jgi:hypothetical protein
VEEKEESRKIQKKKVVSMELLEEFSRSPWVEQQTDEIFSFSIAIETQMFVKILIFLYFSQSNQREYCRRVTIGR